MTRADSVERSEEEHHRLMGVHPTTVASLRADPPSRIAVLLAAHNRRTTTLRCLDALFAQRVEPEFLLTAFLVDDGSTDGTAEAVRSRFPHVCVVSGDGSLFWCGGMRLAFETALEAEERFDHYLWLNDDTVIYPDAVSRLLATHHGLAAEGRGDSIVVGSTIDPLTNKASYGGMRRLWPLPFLRLVPPGRERIRCLTMNGNCTLIPHSVADSVGPIEPELTHLCGDLDYGLRASQSGHGVWIAPGFVGTCEFNTTKLWHDVRLPIRQRFEALRNPRYAIAEKNFVSRRHFGPLWFLTPVAHYAYIVLTHIASRIRARTGR